MTNIKILDGIVKRMKSVVMGYCWAKQSTDIIRRTSRTSEKSNHEQKTPVIYQDENKVIFCGI